MNDTFHIRPIEPRDNVAMAAIIRSVMPEFGADGPGFAIHDAEVDTMYEAYAQPRRGAHAWFPPLLPGNTDRHGRRASAVQAQRLHAAVRTDGRHRPFQLR